MSRSEAFDEIGRWRSTMEIASSQPGLVAELFEAEREQAEADGVTLTMVRRLRSSRIRPAVEYRCGTPGGCLLLQGYSTPAGLACRLGSVRISEGRAADTYGGRGAQGMTSRGRSFHLPERGLLLSTEEQRQSPDATVILACRHLWGEMPLATVVQDARAGRRMTTRRFFSQTDS